KYIQIHKSSNYINNSHLNIYHFSQVRLVKYIEEEITMLSRIKKIFQKKFVRNVFIVASGAVGAQILSLLLYPIITRLYGPEAFGVLGTFTALTKIVIPIAALTYPV